MPRWAVVILSVVAGVAIVVGLGFVFAGGADEEAEVTGGTTTQERTTTGETTTTEETTTQETTTAPPPIPTLRVTVRGGRPVGGIQRLRVRQGERVLVRVVSDVSDHVHVHGYDLFRDVVPGSSASFRFRATLAGRFEIELEDRGVQIAELEVRP